MGQVVGGVDPVDEDHPRLGAVIGRSHQPRPEVRRGQDAMNLAAEGQRPVAAGLQGRHEGVADEHRQVEVAEPGAVPLGVDEGLDVRVLDPQAAHHRPAPLAGGHDGAAHGVPHIHEAERPGSVRRDARHEGPGRTNGGEVHADPAALLQGQGRFADMLEDAAQVVGDHAHDEAVEQGHRPGGPGAGDDPPGRQEAVVAQGVVELGFDRSADIRIFRLRDRVGDAPPGILDRALALAVARREAVFAGPDFSGQRGVERHGVLARQWVGQPVRVGAAFHRAAGPSHLALFGNPGVDQGQVSSPRASRRAAGVWSRVVPKETPHAVRHRPRA